MRAGWKAIPIWNSSSFVVTYPLHAWGGAFWAEVVADTDSNHLVATGGTSLPLVMPRNDEHCQTSTCSDGADPNVIEERGPTPLKRDRADGGDYPKQENSHAAENERPAND